MFSTGLRLAMPVIVLLMLVEIALALMGRMHQQLPVPGAVLPVKMLATLASGHNHRVSSCRSFAPPPTTPFEHLRKRSDANAGQKPANREADPAPHRAVRREAASRPAARRGRLSVPDFLALLAWFGAAYCCT